MKSRLEVCCTVASVWRVKKLCIQGGVSERGVRFTLTIASAMDLSRDVLKVCCWPILLIASHMSVCIVNCCLCMCVRVCVCVHVHACV